MGGPSVKGQTDALESIEVLREATTPGGERWFHSCLRQRGGATTHPHIALISQVFSLATWSRGDRRGEATPRPYIAPAQRHNECRRSETGASATSSCYFRVSRWMERARPVWGSASMSTADRRTSPLATSKRAGSWLRNFRMTKSFSIPMTES